MSRTRPTNEQAALWNGRAGRAWVEAQEVLDQMFKPFEDLLVEAVAAGSAQAACSTSAAARAARRSPSRGGSERKGRCIGIDISEPMIAAARARAEREGAAGDASSAPTRRATRSSPRAST